MLYPLKFKALLKERIWGGEWLATGLGKKLPAGKKIGESWEISGVDGDISVVANGLLKGNNLQELVEVYMGDLVGDAVYAKFGLNFPLLIKLLDAQDVLSIQVHPNDLQAAERHNSYGKTEMWYVMDCVPGSELYLGFEGNVTRDQYLEAVEKGTLPSILKKYSVKPGDTFFIPAGVIHAIGRGIQIAEIQQTSDITYRVDDWGRVDDSGKPREIHTELAVDVIDFGNKQNFDVTRAPKAGEVVQLVSCPYFTTSIVEVDGKMEMEYSKLDSFVVYIILDGALEVGYSKGAENVKAGETLLIPASEDEITLVGKARLLEVYIK